MASKVGAVVLVKVVGDAHALGLLTLAEVDQVVRAAELLSTGDGAFKLSQTAGHLWVLGQIGLSGGQGVL
ncbi:MAG: hypothetical protein ACLQVK_01755 [Acidimicrobiales bacterium]